METVGGLVAGSHNRNQLVVIRGEDQGQQGSRSNLDRCRACHEPVGLNADGELFVACYECGLPACHKCYEHARRNKKGCPDCKNWYRRQKGFPRVEGDPEEDNVDDIENEFRRPTVGPSQQHMQWPQGDLDGHMLHQQHMQYPIRGRNPLLLTNGTAYSDDGGSIAGDSEVSTRAFDVLSNQHSFVGGPDGGHPLMSPARSHGDAPGPYEAQREARRLAKRQLTPSDGRDPEGYGFGSIAVTDAKRAKQQGTLGPVPEQVEGEDLEGGQERPPPPPPEGDGPNGFMADDRESLLEDDGRQPLSRKVPLPPARIYPYRLVIVLRLVVVALFFRYRIMNPVNDAFALWLTSVICEIWFAFSWILDQFPKWFPVNRETYPTRLFKRFEEKEEMSKLEPVDLFVSTVDPIKEPILTTANTLLSILAMDYPVEKVSCYLSDDGAAYLTFEACRETADFAKLWVPFCKKYDIEPRAPEMYFQHKQDYTKGQVDTSLVQARRIIKKEYDAFRVRLNALVKTYEQPPEEGWVMADGTLWPGNDYRDHPGMIQVFLGPSGAKDVEGNQLPRLAYVSREKRPGYNHHKKAGAMNALVRVSAVLTNAPYLLNLDCDHYVNNSRALREAMCFMMDKKVGKRVCYVQFPQRFDGIDKHDRYANHNTVFFDINMRGLDGLQGPVYVGTGCCFRRLALYGFDAPEKEEKQGHLGGLCCCLPWCCCCCFGRKGKKGDKKHSKKGGLRVLHGLHIVQDDADEDHAGDGLLQEEERHLLEKRFGPSSAFVTSVFVHDTGLPPPQKERLMAEYLAHKGEESKGVHTAGDPKKQIKELINVLTCGYEDKSDWGKELGWIYGSVTEDILTGFKMHCRGWRSIYCMPKRPAFKGSAPINLSDRLQQVLRWALGSVEIFFSNHCPIWYSANGRLKCLQRLAYINTVVYPFTAFPLLAYCTLPAICLITNKFIVPTLSSEASILYVALFISIFGTAILEIRWSGIGLEEWWRNEQFWVIGGVSSHFFAVAQGLLKVLAGVDTNFTVTSKQADDNSGEYSELYLFKWTSLLIPPTTLIFLNLFGILAGFAVAITGGYEAWGPFLGKFFFAMWVVVHLYPFLKGLMGRHDRTPTLIIVWSVLLASIFCLLWVKVDPFISKGGGPKLVVCGIKC